MESYRNRSLIIQKNFRAGDNLKKDIHRFQKCIIFVCLKLIPLITHIPFLILHEILQFLMNKSNPIFLFTAITLLTALLHPAITLSDSSPTSCSQKSPSDSKITILTFYIKQEVEQAEDFIEVTLTILQKGSSLKKTIETVKGTLTNIKNIARNYCMKYSQDECDETIDFGQVKIEPSYQAVRKTAVFNGFSVSQEVKLTVKQTESIGQLVDSILNVGVYRIDGFQWKPEVQIDPEEAAIDSGLKQANDLCTLIKMKVGEILAIEEVVDEDQDVDGNGQEDQDKEQDDGQEPAILKFQVQCLKPEQKGSSSGKKKSKSKK